MWSFMTIRRILVVLVLTAVLASAQKSLSQRQEWNQPFPPLHIVGNVYYVGAAGVSSYLITTPQGLIVLDGGLPETAPQIVKNIRSLGFKVEDVKYLLNSHAHYDHSGGLAELKKASGAKLVISRPDAPWVEAGEHDLYAPKTTYKMPAVHVDRIIDDGATVELGGAKLTAHITPGHTKGCTSWTMPVTENGQKHEVMFYCSTSVPGYPLIDNKEYPNIVSDYRASFAKLRKMNADVFLAPHGNFFDLDAKKARMGGGKPNPFIDPKEFQAFVEQSSREFEKNLKEQQASARK